MCGTHTTEILEVKFADEQRAEEHRVLMICNLLEADALTGKSTSDVTQFAAPFDVTMRTHTAHHHGCRVGQVCEAVGQGS